MHTPAAPCRPAGKQAWASTFRSSNAADAPSAVSPGVQLARQFSNALDLAFFQFGGQVFAVRPEDGSTAWHYPTFGGERAIATGFM